METTSPFNTGNAHVGAHDAASAAHNVVDQATATANEAAHNLPPVVDHASRFAHRVVDKVADVVSAPGAWIEKSTEVLRTTQRDVAAQTQDYVAAHPWRAMAMAFAAGLLVGRLAR